MKKSIFQRLMTVTVHQVSQTYHQDKQAAQSMLPRVWTLAAL